MNELEKSPGTFGFNRKARTALADNPPAGTSACGRFARFDASDPGEYFVLSGAGEAINGIVEGNYAAEQTKHLFADGIRHIKLSGDVDPDEYVQAGALGTGVAWDGSSPVGGKAVRGGVSGDVIPIIVNTVSVGAIGASTSRSDGHGGGETYVINTEEITLSLVGATTDSVANLLPANSEILGFAYYWTQAGVALTNWAAGDATTAARFHAADTTFTLGASGVDLSVRNPANTNAAGPVQVAAAKLRITQTGTQATAGKVRVVVYARTLAAPTS